MRERGWAIDDEERTDGMRCVAAPIRDEIGEVVAAISISGPTARFSHARIWELGPEVKGAAREITHSIGGTAGGTSGVGPGGAAASPQPIVGRPRIR